MLRTTFTSTTTLVSLIVLAATASCASVRGTEKSVPVAAPDCLIEEMKRTEGYVPPAVCAHGRPIFDDSREDKRNRMR